jgi:hypothetical protein
MGVATTAVPKILRISESVVPPRVGDGIELERSKVAIVLQFN